MAQTDSISNKALSSVRSQIAAAIKLTKDKRFISDSASLQPRRTLSLWGIEPTALKALMEGVDPSELGVWARPLEGWHHQLRFSTENLGFARSKASIENPVEITLQELSMSSKAKKIDAAINWVEQELQSNPEKYNLPSPYNPIIRLLEIPSRRVTSLLLFDETHDDTHINIVDALPGNERLRPGALLNSEEFLKGLAAQPSPRGIN